jgi:SAM-dependent methyltransferase
MLGRGKRSAKKGTSGADREAWRRTYESHDYRELPWFSEEPTPWFVEALRSGWIKPPGSTLDIGCGAGTNAIWFAKEGFTASGIDLSPGAIRAARERAHSEKLDVKFVEGDALALPFPDRSFDVVSDNGCFHTLPIRRRKDYSKEVSRVLVPGGTFLISWVGREADSEHGPPHRPSLEEVTHAFEELFLFRRSAFFPPEPEELATYGAFLKLREKPQPQVR